MGQAYWWLVGGAALLVSATAGASEPSNGDDGDLWAPGVLMYSPQLRRFAAAIARAEGFGQPGAIPTRNHNPGDLKSSSVASIGADAQGHLMFSSDTDGWEALYRQLHLIVTGRSRVYTLNMTIADMARRYAGWSDNWAANVASYLGVPTSTPLREVLS